MLSLVGCENTENNTKVETLKTLKEVTKEETKEAEKDIEIDWSKLTGNVYYEEPESGLFEDDTFDLYLILNIPKDMDQLYYSRDIKYAGHKNIKLLLNGEHVEEVENEDGSNWEDVIETVRTSNRIIFKAKYKLDGTLSEENYDIEDPDGNIHHIGYEFIEDEEFMEKELDIYKTADGFYWFPSKDITVQRGDKLEWDINGMWMNIPSREWSKPLLGDTRELRARDSNLEIEYTYKTKPTIYYNLGYTKPWSIEVRLSDDVTEEEFMNELIEQGLYLRVEMDKGSPKMIKLIDYQDTDYGL